MIVNRSWPAYEYQPSFILGFHGCDQTVGEGILRGEIAHLNPSRKDYDWLGHGIYFWEGNPRRAYEWAESRAKAGDIEHPFVLGSIIDLRHCLDLFDSHGLRQVADAHLMLRESLSLLGKSLPQNVGDTPDKLGRKLDCAVINALHGFRAESEAPEFDSVRGPFLEGDPLYPGAGFKSHNHIQICVRNTACIKGYFRPIPD